MRIKRFGTGKMGAAVRRVAEERGHTIVSEAPDVAIDFSHASIEVNIQQAGTSVTSILEAVKMLLLKICWIFI